MSIDTVFEFAHAHATTMTVVAIASLVMVVGSALLAPWWLTRLPPEQLERLQRGERRRLKPDPLWRAILKNTAGVVLLIAGVAMLVLPGQGLLTILAALLLLRFPGKRRLFCWLLRTRWAQRILAWARRRAERRS